MSSSEHFAGAPFNLIEVGFKSPEHVSGSGSGVGSGVGAGIGAGGGAEAAQTTWNFLCATLAECMFQKRAPFLRTHPVGHFALFFLPIEAVPNF